VRLEVDPPATGEEDRAPGGTGATLVAEVTAGSVASLRLHPGTHLWAGVKAIEATAYPR
jgi:hypothetical protein